MMESIIGWDSQTLPMKVNLNKSYSNGHILSFQEHLSGRRAMMKQTTPTGGPENQMVTMERETVSLSLYNLLSMHQKL